MKQKGCEVVGEEAIGERPGFLDPSWDCVSESALLLNQVDVPGSFPDGTPAQPGRKRVSLKDYWRWSIGLPGEERLMSDAELMELGLLVEVDGALFHLILALDMTLKKDPDSQMVRMLSDMIAARSGLPSLQPERRSFYPVVLTCGCLPGSTLRGLQDGSVLIMDQAIIYEADFTGQVIGSAMFFSTRFIGRAAFVDTVFETRAYIEYVTFCGSADFHCAIFRCKAEIGFCHFLGTTSFRNALFDQRASFEDCKFSGSTQFDNTMFAAEVTFARADFIGNARFHKTVFQGFMGFSGTHLRQEVRFEEVTWHNRTMVGPYEVESQISTGSGVLSGPGEIDLRLIRWQEWYRS